MRGNRTTKSDNLATQAFESPNLSDLGSGKLGLSINQNDLIDCDNKKGIF